MEAFISILICLIVIGVVVTLLLVLLRIRNDLTHLKSMLSELNNKLDSKSID